MAGKDTGASRAGQKMIAQQSGPSDSGGPCVVGDLCFSGLGFGGPSKTICFKL